MPKMTDRERLAKIEADQQTLARQAEAVRLALRSAYAAAMTDLPVERLTEREFRDVLVQAIRVGGTAASAAMKGLAGSEGAPPPSSRRPVGDETPGPASPPTRTPARSPAALPPGAVSGHASDPTI